MVLCNFNIFSAVVFDVTEVKVPKTSNKEERNEIEKAETGELEREEKNEERDLFIDDLEN